MRLFVEQYAIEINDLIHVLNSRFKKELDVNNTDKNHIFGCKKSKDFLDLEIADINKRLYQLLKDVKELQEEISCRDKVLELHG